MFEESCRRLCEQRRKKVLCYYEGYKKVRSFAGTSVKEDKGLWVSNTFVIYSGTYLEIKERTAENEFLSKREYQPCGV